MQRICSSVMEILSTEHNGLHWEIQPIHQRRTIRNPPLFSNIHQRNIQVNPSIFTWVIDGMRLIFSVLRTFGYHINSIPTQTALSRRSDLSLIENEEVRLAIRFDLKERREKEHRH